MLYKFSTANGMIPDTVPEELRSLSFLEEMLISKVLLSIYRVFQKSVTILIACHSHDYCRKRLYFGQVAPNICRF